MFQKDRDVARLTLPAGKVEALIADKAVTGLYVRLRPGSKIWLVRYSVGGRRAKVALGDVGAVPLAEARRRAAEIVGGAREGRDAAAERRAAKAAAKVAADTLGTGIADYMAGKARPHLRPRALAEVERYLERYAAPLHPMPLAEVGRREVATLLATVAREHGPIAANRCRQYMSACFAWLCFAGRVAANPVLTVPDVAPERRRDRVLSDDELRAIWTACNGSDFGQIVRMLILTGQRRDEVAAMEWAEVDTAAALWRLPAERTKNRRAHEVPLSLQATAVLTDRERDGRTYVFGRDAGAPFSGYSAAKRRLDTGSGVVAWTLHDLRRTAVTGMVEIGIAPHVVEAIVNHVSGAKGGVAGIYNRALHRPEKAKALQRWADHIERVVSDTKAASVVPLAGRR